MIPYKEWIELENLNISKAMLLNKVKILMTNAHIEWKECQSENEKTRLWSIYTFWYMKHSNLHDECINQSYYGQIM